MKVKLQTKVLQDLLAKAMKGVGGGTLMRTQWLGIKVKKNILSLTAWDGKNYLTVAQAEVPCDDFELTVTAETFNKLIAKTTKEEVELIVNDKYLEVKGNGKYKLELPVNEEGELDIYPEITFDKKGADKGTVKLSEIKQVITNCKVALAKTRERIYFTGYHFDEVVLTTDSNRGAFVANNLFDQPVLLPDEVMQLLAICDDEDIKFFKKGNQMLFETSNVTILGYEVEGADVYPAEALLGLYEKEFPSNCLISCSTVLEVLDRLSIFLDAKQPEVTLMFTDKGIQFVNKEGSINELVTYETSSNFKAYECRIDPTHLKEVITARGLANIKVHYGLTGDFECLKLGEEKVQHTISIIEDEVK